MLDRVKYRPVSASLDVDGLNKYRNIKLNGFKKYDINIDINLKKLKKNYININTELNVYQIIEYCYNRRAIPSWFNPYAVTTVKRILLFKVTKFEHELQKESNVLSVMKRLSSSSLR